MIVAKFSNGIPSMARVKGSKQQRMVVVPHTPLRNAFRKLLVILFVVVSGASGYWYGISQGFIIRDNAESTLAEMEGLLVEKSDRLSESSLRIATLERGTEVDRQATEDTRQLVKDLQDRVAELEDEVSLYKGIMTPSLLIGGLTVQDFSITPTSNTQRFRFKMMLTQVGDNKNFVQGFAGVTIIGEQDGQKKALLLKDLSEQISTTDIKFRYRYFQDFSGELALPEGFTPEQIYVVAQTSGAGSARVERYFNWVSGEANANVEQ